MLINEQLLFRNLINDKSPLLKQTRLSNNCAETNIKQFKHSLLHKFPSKSNGKNLLPSEVINTNVNNLKAKWKEYYLEKDIIFKYKNNSLFKSKSLKIL